jgi:hypothetical protein
LKSKDQVFAEHLYAIAARGIQPPCDQAEHLGARALIEPPRSVGRGHAIAGLLGGSRRNQSNTVDRRENSDESRSAMISSPAT